MIEELLCLQDAVLLGQANRTKNLTKIVLDQGIPAKEVLDSSILAALRIISEQLRNNEVYIADVILVSRAVHAGLHVLEPYLSHGEQIFRAKAIVGTVAGDLHDIGKNLIIAGLTSLGIEVVDLGVDIYPEDFAQAIHEYHPDILGLSAMLTTTMSMISETIWVLKEEHLRDKVKIIIGGNPVTEEFCQTVGADGWSPDINGLKTMLDEIL